MKNRWVEWKKAYNKWLFQKFGFTGKDFNSVPIVYKLVPLWSPSLYTNYELERWSEIFAKGFDEGAKEGLKRNLKSQESVLDYADQIAVSLGIDKEENHED